MFIVPMNSSITPLDTMTQKIAPAEKETKGESASFSDIFKEAYNNVQETQRISEEDNIRVALGEIDDLHTVNLNAKKAAMALEVFVSLKNTAVDAYNEVMRMNI